MDGTAGKVGEDKNRSRTMRRQGLKVAVLKCADKQHQLALDLRAIGHDVVSLTTKDQRLSDYDLTLVPVTDNPGVDYFKNEATQERLAELGEKLKNLDTFHTLLFQGCLPPGTMDQVILPILEAVSGKKAGQGFGVCLHTGQLTLKPSTTTQPVILGVMGQASEMQMREAFKPVTVCPVITSIQAVELMSYAQEAWRATQSVFANEMCRLSKALGVNGQEFSGLMSLCSGQMNSMTACAEGGTKWAPMPRHVKSLREVANSLAVDLPMMRALNFSSELELANILDQIKNASPKRVGFLGVTTEAGCSGLSDSPYLALMLMLMDHEIEVGFYDPHIPEGAELEAQLEHIVMPGLKRDGLHQQLLSKREMKGADIAGGYDVIVVSHSSREMMQTIAGRALNSQVLDLTSTLCK